MCCIKPCLLPAVIHHPYHCLLTETLPARQTSLHSNHYSHQPTYSSYTYTPWMHYYTINTHACSGRTTFVSPLPVGVTHLRDIPFPHWHIHTQTSSKRTSIRFISFTSLFLLGFVLPLHSTSARLAAIVVLTREPSGVFLPMVLSLCVPLAFQGLMAQLWFHFGTTQWPHRRFNAVVNLFWFFVGF